MSIRSWLQRVMGISPFPTREERLAVRHDWRDAIHDHSAEATRLIGAAKLSRKVSDEAIGTFQKTMQTQEKPPDHFEVEQLRSIRAWLMSRDEDLRALTAKTLDRTRK